MQSVTLRAHRPAYSSFAFFTGDNNDVQRKACLVWEKILESVHQLNNVTAGGTVNIHVFHIRLKQLLFSLPPSPIPQSPKPPSLILGQFDYET
jgi:hypothetical protein